MKKRKLMVALLAAVTLGTTITATVAPPMTALAYEHHPRMTDEWVIQYVLQVKEGWSDDAKLAEAILAGAVNQRQTIYVLDNGVCTEYIDTFKENGLIPQDYGSSEPVTAPATAVPEESATPVAEQGDTTTESQPIEEQSTSAPSGVEVDFTVEDMSATMYAVQQVNVRNGAKDTYDKVGALRKDQMVVVTGRASTGWYRIDWNGNAAYVAGQFLTEQGPSEEIVESEVDVPEETIPAESEEGTGKETLETETISVEETESVTEESMVMEGEMEEESGEGVEQTIAETDDEVKEEPKKNRIWMYGIAALIGGAAGALVYFVRKQRKSKK